MKLIITDLKNLNLSINARDKIINPKEKISNCIGCFGCWIRIPGMCIIHDGYERMGINLSKCSELILISRCYYGSFSPFIKTVIDRSISYLHPDFIIFKGKMHHKRRYTNKILISAYFYGTDITEKEKETARKIIFANSDNLDGAIKKIEFYHSEKELEGIIL